MEYLWVMRLTEKGTFDRKHDTFFVMLIPQLSTKWLCEVFYVSQNSENRVGAALIIMAMVDLLSMEWRIR